jgi:hypothetical protein
MKLIRLFFTAIVFVFSAYCANSADLVQKTAAADLTVADVDNGQEVNNNINDVIGNKLDSHDGTSLMAFSKKLDEHVHSANNVYPDKDDPIQITSGAGDWELGSFVTIVSSNTITLDFDIHQVIIEDFDTKEKTYQLQLYKGQDDTFIGSIRFSSTANKGNIDNGSFQTEKIIANSRIRARLCVQDGGSKTASVSIRYHTY